MLDTIRTMGAALVQGVRPVRDYVEWKDLRLPLPSHRFCTEDWKDDDYFVESAKKEVARLKGVAGLGPDSTLLDIGSGQGRLAIGLISSLPELRAYYGLDVSKVSIEWCTRNISAFHSNFCFLHLDIRNERYNPQGVLFRAPIQLPFMDDSFDVVFLYSVFTHMLSDDIAPYLRDMARVMRPNGHALFTVYAEDNCENELENPAGYLEELGKSTGSLHRVRFNRNYFDCMVKEAGLNIVHFFPRSEEVTKQSAYLVTPVVQGKKQ